MRRVFTVAAATSVVALGLASPAWAFEGGGRVGRELRAAQANDAQECAAS
jgi:hypothetical protein